MNRSPGLLAALVAVTALLVSLPSSAATAQLRPTSDDLSIHGGRTMGNGDVAISGALGWPGLWVDVLLAPSSRFNIAIRGHVDYGAQVGTDIGFGGGLSLPMRLLVHASGDLDLSLSLRPFFGLGEGAYVGQQGVFSDDLGIVGSLDAGFRASFRLGSMATLSTGAHGTFGYLATFDAEASNVFGAVSALGAVELVMSRSTMLFIALDVGYAFVPAALFSNPIYLRGSIGMAYRL